VLPRSRSRLHGSDLAWSFVFLVGRAAAPMASGLTAGAIKG
jgi:hypothetical protein